MFLLTSCGSKTKLQEESNKNNESHIINPEELISKEEAEEIVGSSFPSTKNTDQKAVGLKLVFYDEEDDYFQISLTQQAFMPETQTSTPESLYNSLKNAQIKTLEELEEVGAENFYEDISGLSILHEGYYISIKMGKFSGTDLKRQNITTKEMYIEAGKLAIKNLKEKLK